MSYAAKDIQQIDSVSVISETCDDGKLSFEVEAVVVLKDGRKISEYFEWVRASQLAALQSFDPSNPEHVNNIQDLFDRW